MELNDIIILIYGAICWFAFGQMEASGNIGNRSYSTWYSTHCLMEKKGLCKLIYFKPKHFDRYTLYEVISFFVSYISIIVFATLGVLSYVHLINTKVMNVIVISSTVLILLLQLVIVLINDIGSHRDKKRNFILKMEKEKRFHRYLNHCCQRTINLCLR